MSEVLAWDEQVSSGPRGDYATADSFRKLLASEIMDLFRLAFLLTADAEKAEYCMMLAMHECVSSGAVSTRQLPGLARCAVIRNGIRIVAGIHDFSAGSILPDGPAASICKTWRSAECAFDDSVGILMLSDMERLVYVICVIEQYPTMDCALFLGRSQHEIPDAQKRASAQVAAFEQEWCHLSNVSSSSARSLYSDEELDVDGSWRSS